MDLKKEIEKKKGIEETNTSWWKKKKKKKLNMGEFCRLDEF